MNTERLTRMKALVAALGGEDAVLSRLGLKGASLKVAYHNRVFSPQWFGAFLELAAEKGEAVSVPTDLFGAHQERAWAPMNVEPRKPTESAA